MNFPTTRVQPEQIGEEPTDFGGFTSASIEDETPVSFTTYLLASIAFILAAVVLGYSVGYWLHIF